MRHIILILFLLGLQSSVSFAQWTEPFEITPGVPFTEERTATVDSIIYAVGGNLPFYFMKSTNNGATWSQPFTPAPADTFYNCDMPDIIYSNSKIHIAWIGYFSDQQRQKVFHISSSDGGVTWSSPHRVFNNNFPLLKYPRLAAKGDTLILSCLISSTTQAYIPIFRSYNGGTTWRDSTVAEPVAWAVNSWPNILYSQDRIHLIYQMSLLNPDSSGIEIFYRQSSDFGMHWSDRISLSNFPDHIAGQFPSACTDGEGNILTTWFDYRYGNYCWTTGEILTRTSTDNGDSWLPSGRVTFTQSGDESRCLIIGGILHVVWIDYWPYGCGNPKIMYSSSPDWGMGWYDPILISEPQSNIEQSPAFACTIVGGDTALHAFMTRSDTLGGSGLFYMRSHPFVSVKDDGEGIALPVKLTINAYPNPFNSSTILTLNSNDDIPILIFDITGRLVTSLNAYQGKAVWDATGYSSGVYLARVRGENSSPIKLILLK
jgi:hypothetical protein